jgi:hypothetical protein
MLTAKPEKEKFERVSLFCIWWSMMKSMPDVGSKKFALPHKLLVVYGG